MKAKVIATQEIIDVEEYNYDYFLGVKTFKNIKSGGVYPIYDLEFDVKEQINPTKEIDWEQRRFELIKAAMPIIMQIPTTKSATEFQKFVAEVSIEYADAVIAKLKEE